MRKNTIIAVALMILTLTVLASCGSEEPVDITVEGTFGAYLNSGKITFDAADVDPEY